MHAFVTTMLDTGVDLRGVQITARHADPPHDDALDRAHNLDRHPNYILAAFSEVISAAFPVTSFAMLPGCWGPNGSRAGLRGASVR
ncbi:hypothetical protein [Actinocorallia longicatena]|uniref:Uncharacterized protein n=1 Tax=Actinocorallia longicatena TaxID=111803 RepID=A0ABP6PYE3_9ACTN